MNPLIQWINAISAMMIGQRAQFSERTHRGSKITSKCHHGTPGKAGDKIAKMAAEKRLGVPRGIKL